MTDFVSICSFMAGDDMRELGEVSFVVHRTVLPAATSVPLSPVQYPAGQEQGDRNMAAKELGCEFPMDF